MIQRLSTRQYVTLLVALAVLGLSLFAAAFIGLAAANDPHPQPAHSSPGSWRQP